MEKTPNPKSVGFAPIWLKSVSLTWDWLELTIAWQKEVIWAELGAHHIMQSWELRPLSLLHTCGLIWMSFGGCRVNKLRCQSDQLSDWQLHSVRLSSDLVRLRSSSDWLHIQLQSLSPWELRPPWARFPVFAINKATISSSKLVRVGLKGLLL